MADEREKTSAGGSAGDSVGHGEWRGIAPPVPDMPVLDAHDAGESNSTEGSAATGEPTDELDPDEPAHDMSAELGLGYRDYGVGSQPPDEDADG